MRWRIRCSGWRCDLMGRLRPSVLFSLPPWKAEGLRKQAVAGWNRPCAHCA